MLLWPITVYILYTYVESKTTTTTKAAYKSKWNRIIFFYIFFARSQEFIKFLSKRLMRERDADDHYTVNSIYFMRHTILLCNKLIKRYFFFDNFIRFIEIEYNILLSSGGYSKYSADKIE